MNKKKITSVAVALALGFSSVAAIAQPRPQGPQGPQGHGPAPHMQQGPQGHPVGPQAHRPGHAPQMQSQHRPPMKHPHGIPPGQAKRMGAGPNHNWVKGSRVPHQYRSHQYVVNDWRHHGLKAPPRGYQWVQYGGDYLLVAIATGVITQLILGH